LSSSVASASPSMYRQERLTMCGNAGERSPCTAVGPQVTDATGDLAGQQRKLSVGGTVGVERLERGRGRHDGGQVGEAGHPVPFAGVGGHR
jgi:hypothetical protein